MANERDLLNKLVSATKAQLERPVATMPTGTSEQVASDEEARRLAALRNPPRKY